MRSPRCRSWRPRSMVVTAAIRGDTARPRSQCRYEEAGMLLRATRAIGAFAGLLGVAACSVFGGAAAPEPEYSVVLAEPPLELRDYCELVVAKTPMKDGSGAAFGRLFDYISGENSGARDIAMTAPVLDTEGAGGAEIEMTAPVLQGREGSRAMVFVL